MSLIFTEGSFTFILLEATIAFPGATRGKSKGLEAAPIFETLRAENKIKILSFQIRFRKDTVAKRVLNLQSLEYLESHNVETRF